MVLQLAVVVGEVEVWGGSADQRFVGLGSY